jgi:hypothetical protein
VTTVRDFLIEIDSLWLDRRAERLPLEIIGSGALMLQVDYERPTKDSDILETRELTSDVKAQLVALAGKDTPLHKRRRLYVDIVGNGIPFRRQCAQWIAVADLNARLGCFHVSVLGIVDVVVSKLARFIRNDVADIEAMVSRNLVPHEQMVGVFRDAMVFCEDRADRFPGYVDNLHTVERDIFGVDESEIELPSWS